MTTDRLKAGIILNREIEELKSFLNDLQNDKRIEIILSGMHTPGAIEEWSDDFMKDKMREYISEIKGMIKYREEQFEIL